MSVEKLKLRHRTRRGVLWVGAVMICAFGVIKFSIVRDPTNFVSSSILATLSCAVIIMIGHRILRLRERRDYQRAQLCYHCGYDLRATRERCPECGEVIGVE
ncbi:MAG TPA: hypothetical protein VH370_25170 [Humisphaera sp.]|jgi:hypothetical protein|nr:hypothetical protein [Humisphaera sp.]